MSVKRNLFSRLTRTRLLFPLLLIVLLLPALYWYTTRPKETAAWWNESWIYRKRIDVSNPGGSDLTDFQISFTLDTTDTSKFQGNCEDLRVTGVDGNLLPFWIEENNPGCGDANTKVWVKLPSIPSSGTYIYAYYGNPSASVSSDHDGNKVFEFFDDFESYELNQPPPGYTTKGTATALIKDSSGKKVLEFFSVNAGTFIFKNDLDLSDFHLHSAAAASNNYFALITRVQNTDLRNYYAYNYGANTSTKRYFRYFNDVAYNIATISESWNNSQFYPISIKSIGNTISFYDNDTLKGSTTWTDFSSGSVGIANGGNNITQQFRYFFVTKTATTEPTTSSQSEEVGPGPIAFWKFDEGTGGTANDSIQNNNGNITGAVWQTEDQCVSGKCLYFDGNGDYINNVQLPLRVAGSQAHTISVWFKTGASSTGPLLMLGDNNNLDSSGNADGAIGWESGSGNITTTIHNGAGHQSVSAANTYRDSQWHLLTSVLDSSSLKLYIDGVFIGENTNAKTSAAYTYSSNPYFWIATRSKDSSLTVDNVQYFSGYLDEFKIYPYARTAAQILQDYNQYSNSIGSGSTSLSNGLVGYWKMDEASWNGTSNEVIDSSGGSHHGTSVNGTSTLVGKYGKAGSFDGIDDYLNLGSFLSNENMSQMSVSVWLKLDEICTGNAAVISKSNYFYIHCWNNEFQFSALTGNGVSGTAGTGPYNINEWIMVTMTYDSESNQVISYLNGEQKNTGSLDGNPIIMGTSNFLIGKRTNYIKGKVDEVRVYNRTLSASEISSLYHYAPGPVGYWDFNEGSGGTAFDKSGNNYDGTLNNSPTWTQGKYGGGLEFDGTSNRSVSIGGTSAANFEFNNESFTVSAWVKPRVNGVSSGIVRKGQGTIRSGYGILIANSNQVEMIYSDTYESSDQKIRFGSTNAGEWIYITQVIDRETNTAKGYINGIYQTSMSIEGITSLNSAHSLIIGEDNAYDANAVIDEVKIYNYARTEEQIRQDMAGTANPGIGSSNILPQPVSHWSFDEQTGQTAYDKIGGKNGTLGANTSIGSDDPTWKTQSSCKTNGCLSFDGDDNISLGSISDSSTSHTFTMWVKSSTTPSGLKYLFDIGPTRNVMAWHYSDGNLAFYDGTWRISNYQAPADGEWHHLAYIQNGTTNKGSIYVDGVAVATNLTYQPIPLVGTAVIGNRYIPSITYGVNAYIDEFKIYNTALSIEQIKQDINTGSTLSVGTTTSEAADLSDGEGNPPIAEWKLDEMQGSTVSDTSGNNYNGTINGATWHAWCKQGGCLSFNGTNNYIDGFSTSNMASFTIVAWIKTTSTDLINVTSGGSAGSYISISGGQVRWYDGNGWRIGTSYVNDGNWHQIFYIFDNGAHYFGVDGNLEYNNNNGNGTYTSGNVTTIGVWSNKSTRFFNGLIDHVKIYDYARTPAQIAYDYNRGEPVAHWKMDECQGSTIHDSSDNGNHGTLTVTTTGGNTNGIGTCTTSTSAWGTGASGKFGASLNFDGDGDEIAVPHHTTLLPSSSFSISTWVRYQTGNSGYFITKCYGACSGQAYYLRVINNTFRFRGVSSQGNWLGSFDFGSLNPNTWYHVTVTYVGTNATATGYINGELIKQQDISADTDIYQSSGASLYLGSRNNADFFSGQLDDVRIYNYALSEAQVKKVMNEGSALRFGD